MASAHSGVSGAGLTIIGHPAASAAPALRVIIAIGKFQGVTAAVTPIGCQVTVSRLPVRWLGIVSPYARSPSAANQSRKFAAYSISPRDSLIGLPCSDVMITERSSELLRSHAGHL